MTMRKGAVVPVPSTAVATRANPHTQTANARAGANRRRPTRLNAAAPPSIVPTPSAPVRIPAPGWPVPYTSRASRMNRTSSAPMTMPRRARSVTTSRTSPFSRRTPMPSRMLSRSAARDSPAVGSLDASASTGTGWAVAGSDTTRAAATTKTIAPTANTDGRRPDGQDRGSGQRADEQSGPFDRPGHAVRDAQLLGRARQFRKQGTLGRSGEPDRARRDRGRNVDDEGWQPEDHARPGGAERERLDDVASRQRMGSLRSVGDQRRERRAQGGRDQLGDRNQTRATRAPSPRRRTGGWRPRSRIPRR